jgi:hypothetical protein
MSVLQNDALVGGGGKFAERDFDCAMPNPKLQRACFGFLVGTG